MGCQRLLLAVAAAAGGGARAAECPGTISIPGYAGGEVYIVPSGDPALGQVEVLPGGVVVPHMRGRAYFASSCSPGLYSHEQYLALNLLGKTFRYTTNMAGAGCGCNAVLSLVSMAQNQEPGTCNDFYCDANSVCGVTCAEIDLQEGNEVSWHSTLHAASDRAGVMAGYGGGAGWNGPRDWGAADYSPGSSCIDTSLPFQVAVSFPVDAQGSLLRLEVALSQQGRQCKLSTRGLDNYVGMVELTAALQAGMTPVVNYWSSSEMLFIDGKGADGQGPCAKDEPGACAESVKFSDFAIEDYVPGPAAPGTPGPAPVPVPIPMPAGLDGEHAKIAIYKALSMMCGGEAQAVANTLLNYASSSFDWLDSNDYQGCIAVLVAVAGLASAYDGPEFYKALFLMLVALCSACIARYEMETNGIVLGGFYKFLTLCEVAVVTVMATYVGFEGSQVLLGTAGGFVGAWGIGGWTRQLADTIAGLDCFWYSSGAVIGGLVFTIWRQMVMHVLGPLFGGFLVASGACTGVSRILAGFMRWDQRLPGTTGLSSDDTWWPWLPKPSASWPLAASQLLGVAAARGGLAGGCFAAVTALLIKGYGSPDPDWHNRKMLLSIGTLVLYILVMAIIAVATKGPEVDWRWPIFGCSVWAFVLLVSIPRQLASIEDEEIRDNFQSTNEIVPNALRSLRRLRTRALQEIDGDGSPASGHSPGHRDSPGHRR